ncbi:hypothetical protein M440DRAFT_1102871 [Trichoderma longibrachiatum ATCC 18648]|uniref:Uncharacterized protein n=1 Tax=Trichoderma longibrachiatum ATCC 18648 TaxID=983965 RepID=A0A2T4BRP3_TRILO|nr:hypothetical protein M440DRAFT_1102871 [Trichoderma longibrachiatum ATCC 18648]
MKPRGSLAQRATCHGSEVPVVEEKLRGGARRESNYGRQSALKAPKQLHTGRTSARRRPPILCANRKLDVTRSRPMAGAALVMLAISPRSNQGPAPTEIWCFSFSCSCVCRRQETAGLIIARARSSRTAMRF